MLIKRGGDTLSGKTSPTLDLSDKQDTIMQAIATVREDLIKLQKLDNIEQMNIELHGEVAKVQARVTSISEVVSSVRTDMNKMEKKWEASCKFINNRVAKLEKLSSSHGKKLELSRSSIDKDLEMIQSGIDGNSKKVLEMESFIHQSFSNHFGG